MTDTPRVDTWLAAQRLHDEFDGYSADEIKRMPFGQYARLRERAGLAPVDPVYPAYEPPEVATTVSAPEAAHANADALQGVDPNSDEYFHLWRSQRARGGEGRGALDGGSTADWIAAAQSRGIGRTQYGQQNTQEAARPDAGKYLRANEPVTGRTNFYR